MQSPMARSVGRALPEDQRFDRVAILVSLDIVGAGHWPVLERLADQRGQSNQAAVLLAFHRSLGVVIWLVTVCRFAWRTQFAHLPPFPDSIPKFQQVLAKSNEFGLYALLILQPLTGLSDAPFRGRPFQLFLWQVPRILPRDRAAADLLAEMHHLGAYALLFLIGAHAPAALLHRFILRDNIVQRMLPPPAVMKNARTGKAAAAR